MFGGVLFFSSISVIDERVWWIELMTNPRPSLSRFISATERFRGDRIVWRVGDYWGTGLVGGGGSIGGTRYCTVSKEWGKYWGNSSVHTVRGRGIMESETIRQFAGGIWLGRRQVVRLQEEDGWVEGRL